MRNKFLLILICVLSTSLFDAAFCAPNKMQKVSAVTANRKILIYNNRDLPPYSFINSSGKPDGFFPELTKAIMEELHLNYEVKLINWKNAIELAREGHCDLISGISKTKEREQYFTFGNAYLIVAQALVFKNNKRNANDIELIRNNKIIVEQKGIAKTLLAERGIVNNIIEINDLPRGIDILYASNDKSLMCNYETAAFFIYEKNYEDLTLLDMQIYTNLYAYAGKDSLLLKKVDAAVAKLKANGTYGSIYGEF